ncbi:TonB-dependent siderophore receptor [Xanthobacter sp. AM11]|uniref:TonB-dependent siderophore receptor n=1 Tax=Xanthobacter sp. AM11 TaxID=3380643 RepID=UPI0039BF086E
MDTVVVAGEGAARATPSSAGPVIDYVAEDSRVGTKTDTPLAETPQSITVVGSEQMRDQGVQNLQEAIRYVPGVLADGFGVDTRGDYAVIRGVPAEYFIDGLRSSYGYYVNTIAVEPYALDRVEVLRGPASMLYGQTPVGGIINGASKLPLATPRNEATVEYGTFDFAQFKFDSSGPLTKDGTWLYRVVGLARDAGTQVDYVDNDRLMIAPSLTYRPTDDTSITVLANIRDDKSGSTQQFLPQIGTLTPNKFGQRADFSTFVGEPDDYYNTRAQSGTVFFDHKFNDNLKLHSVTRYSHVENDYKSTYGAILTPARMAYFNSVFGPIFNPADAPFLNAGQSEIARAVTQQFTDTGIFNTDNNLTGTFQTGLFSHEVTAGVDYMRFAVDTVTAGTLVDNALPGQPRFDMYAPTYGQSTYLFSLYGFAVSPDAIPMYVLPHEVQSDTGVYIQDQIKAGPWRFILGARQDWLTIEQEGSPTETETATSTRAAVLYETDFGLNPYLSYSTSFTPQPGSVVGTSIYSSVMGQTLKPAKPLLGEQVEAGFKYQHPTLPLVINGAIYELEQRNQIVQPDVLFDAVQGANINVRGFEIEAIGKILPELKIVASYSYTDATYSEYPELYGYPTGISQFMVGKPVDGIPQHLASLWGVYTVQGGPLRGWSAGGGVRYVGSSQSYGRDIATQKTIDVQTPSYTLFDAMVAFENEHWRWQLTAQNLANTFYVTSCLAYRGDCGVGQARTVITALTYKF